MTDPRRSQPLSRFRENPIALWTLRATLLVPWFPVALEGPAAVAQAAGTLPLWLLLPHLRPLGALLGLLILPIQVAAILLSILVAFPLGTFSYAPEFIGVTAFWGWGYAGLSLVALTAAIPIESALRARAATRSPSPAP